MVTDVYTALVVARKSLIELEKYYREPEDEAANSVEWGGSTVAK
jgi:hypothetical protein